MFVIKAVEHSNEKKQCGDLVIELELVYLLS